MKGALTSAAFSLVETVVALGLFAFCILGVLALIPVGMGSARSVAEESAAASLADAFFGAWLVAPTNANATEFEIPFMFTNPAVPINRAANGIMFFRGDGEQVASATDDATLQLDYNITDLTAQAGGFALDLVFQWPPGQSNAATQIRRFHQFIAR